ncbi:MAG: hypothetical protein NC341_00775 [Blautia sp.]|nr:hypothetical protein [Blautia sp.]MCM1202162.1 hypothetical protein [Bacteroides fragilis]
MKKLIKGLIGEERAHDLRASYEYLKSLKYNFGSRNIVCGHEPDYEFYQLEMSRKHVFCGYFDITPDNPDNPDEILVNVLEKNARAGRDPLEIWIADYKKGTFYKAAETRAWCWQMGCRSRWSHDGQSVYYNEYRNGGYILIKKKILTEEKKDYPMAVYDIAPDEKWGLSLNFDRLQALRPGYGYSNNMDGYVIDSAVPANDGIYFVDLEKGREELIVTYKELNALIPDIEKGAGYINHISIAPDSRHAMFFYVWQSDRRPGFKATLWVMNVFSGELKCLERKDIVSHYAWIDASHILITGVDQDYIGFYRIYNIETGSHETIESPYLKQDGHPGIVHNGISFFSDTYPDDQYKQHFFYYENGKYERIVSLYHNPLMYGEKRCDLHPHIFRDRNRAALDTTYQSGKRSILVVEPHDERTK